MSVFFPHAGVASRLSEPCVDDPGRGDRRRPGPNEAPCRAPPAGAPSCALARVGGPPWQRRALDLVLRHSRRSPPRYRSHSASPISFAISQASRAPFVLHLPLIDTWALEVDLSVRSGVREDSVSAADTQLRRAEAAEGGDGGVGSYLQRVLVRLCQSPKHSLCSSRLRWLWAKLLIYLTGARGGSMHENIDETLPFARARVPVPGCRRRQGGRRQPPACRGSAAAVAAAGRSRRH